MRYLLGFFIVILLAACSRQEHADLVLKNAKIWTVNPNQPEAEALAAQKGKIIVIGSAAEMEKWIGNDTRVIDAGGRRVLPGFTDAHVHLSGVGMAAMVLDLVGVESIAALQQRLRDYAASHPEGAIYGRGWIETHWPERRFPTRADLDAVVSDRAVMLERIDGHAAVVNSAGLALAGIDAGTANPDGGAIERDASGAATGVLMAIIGVRFAQAAVAARRTPAPSTDEVGEPPAT